MKRLTLETLPETAKYLGSELPDGSMHEKTADLLDQADNPAFIIDDGCRHFFDLVQPDHGRGFDELRWLPGA